MAYSPTTWTDEVPQSSPVKYTIRDTNGNILYDNVQIDVKTTITTPGTSVNAANLNHIEQGIVTLENATPPKVFTAKGDLLIGTGSGTGEMLALGSQAKMLEAYPTFNNVGIGWIDRQVARYKRTTTQSIPHATTTIINFDTNELDILNRVTTGASWKYTAFMGSYYAQYLVIVAIAFESLPSGITTLDVYKNGAQYARLARANSQFLSGSTIVPCTSGSDYLDFRVNQNNGTALNLVADGTHNHVSIARIR